MHAESDYSIPLRPFIIVALTTLVGVVITILILLQVFGTLASRRETQEESGGMNFDLRMQRIRESDQLNQSKIPISMAKKIVITQYNGVRK